MIYNIHFIFHSSFSVQHLQSSPPALTVTIQSDSSPVQSTPSHHVATPRLSFLLPFFSPASHSRIIIIAIARHSYHPIPLVVSLSYLSSLSGIDTDTDNDNDNDNDTRIPIQHLSTSRVRFYIFNPFLPLLPSFFPLSFTFSCQFHVFISLRSRVLRYPLASG